MVKFSPLAVAALGSFVMKGCSATIFTAQQGRYIGVYDDEAGYSWAQALVHCELLFGSSLASIHSTSDEEDIFDARYLNDMEAWVGLTDQDVEGIWEWIDGSMYDYNVTWSPGQPNNWKGQDCVHIVEALPEELDINVTETIHMNDNECSYEYHQFICNRPAIMDEDSQESSHHHDSTLEKLEENELFIPLMIVTCLLGLCTIIMASSAFYYFICWKRRPKFEMLENDKLSNNTNNTQTNIRKTDDDDDEEDGDHHQVHVPDNGDDDDEDNDDENDGIHGNGVVAEEGDDEE